MKLAIACSIIMFLKNSMLSEKKEMVTKFNITELISGESSPDTIKTFMAYKEEQYKERRNRISRMCKSFNDEYRKKVEEIRHRCAL